MKRSIKNRIVLAAAVLALGGLGAMAIGVGNSHVNGQLAGSGAHYR